MTNSPRQRLIRLIAYRNGYTGGSATERRARHTAVLNCWAAIDSLKIREQFRELVSA